MPGLEVVPGLEVQSGNSSNNDGKAQRNFLSDYYRYNSTLGRVPWQGDMVKITSRRKASQWKAREK